MRYITEIWPKDLWQVHLPGLVAGKCLKDALQENVPRICRGGYVPGISYIINIK